MSPHEQPENNDDVDWDEMDREYEAFLQDAYGGRLPTLEEFKRDVLLIRLELRQRLSRIRLAMGRCVRHNIRKRVTQMLVTPGRVVDNAVIQSVTVEGLVYVVDGQQHFIDFDECRRNWANYVNTLPDYATTNLDVTQTRTVAIRGASTKLPTIDFLTTPPTVSHLNERSGEDIGFAAKI